MTTSLNFAEALLYPESDGEPMSESTEQYRWIVMIKENLEILLVDRPDVLIAADLFWYPIQVAVLPAPRQAPDVMLAFGRPKGPRRSYLQWKEEQVSPQVVFEILSASNKTRDGIEAMEYKFRFYERYGVEEYYIYDPDEFTLEGWQRQDNALVPIASMSGWVSLRLGIRFVWQPRTELELYTPKGVRFLSSIALSQRADQAETEAERARLQANQSQIEAEQARSQAQQERSRAEQAEQSLQASVPRLLALGLTVAQVAEALGLSIGVVESLIDDRAKTIGDASGGN
jgi:Uma2 family endonuclease